MLISWDALNAMDQARQTGEILGFAPCTFERIRVDIVREPLMNLSVVTIRLSMRSRNCGVTENNEDN